MLSPEMKETFEGLPEKIQAIRQEISQLREEVSRPNIEEIINSLQNIVQTDSSAFADKIRQLEEEYQRLRAEKNALLKSYQEAVGIFDMFTNMASISQIMSLGDFKEQMKNIFDNSEYLLVINDK